MCEPERVAEASGGIRAAVDLNADVGEGGPVDAELMTLVSSASVACGFHAGDPLTLLATARLAAASGVALGAHPSYDDREGMGRRDVTVAPERLEADVVYQVGAAIAAATAAGTRLRYVKPHGALYNRAAADQAVADAVVAAIASLSSDGSLALLGLAGSVLVRRAENAGLSVFAEAFADRAYAPDGTLVPRSGPDAVMTDPAEVASQAVAIACRGAARAIDGSWIEVRADSICLHGDTPGALALARRVRAALGDSGVDVQPFA